MIARYNLSELHVAAMSVLQTPGAAKGELDKFAKSLKTPTNPSYRLRPRIKVFVLEATGANTMDFDNKVRESLMVMSRVRPFGVVQRGSLRRS